ncbi:uncharacterized protein DUF2017 [Georgenia soli]|uniref:Uncharacterized protein DUF2017 n=1 Tax=Georgenia soli TaxID=638953 RepID=A0A2A9EJA9_9MICO|nr:DUF2017 domain-containing protein [Georgenia soli]PFG38611.1 uncharacterized protein DUF2017 [Georgenia soli]
MQAFLPVPGGFASRVEDVERTILARLFRDTAELLGTRLDDGGSGPVGAGPGHPVGEEALLAALDFEPSHDRAPDAPSDPALARLLPPMSHDDAGLSAELRALTEDSVRAGKVSRLEVVWRELAAPGTRADAVVVPEGKEAAWLAALTDVRLVLATRLGISDDADAEAVYERAQGAGPEPGDEHDEVTDALATMYAALTWWQESLLEAMSRTRRGR